MLSDTQQTKVLKDSEGVTCGWTGAPVSVCPKEYWHSVVAVVGNTTAILDSSSLNHQRRAYFTAYTRRSIRQGREDVL